MRIVQCEAKMEAIVACSLVLLLLLFSVCLRVEPSHASSFGGRMGGHVMFVGCTAERMLPLFLSSFPRGTETKHLLHTRLKSSTPHPTAFVVSAFAHAAAPGDKAPRRRPPLGCGAVLRSTRVLFRCKHFDLA